MSVRLRTKWFWVRVQLQSHWEASCDSKRPKSKSHKRLAEHHLDKTILVIMQFAEDVASQLKVFLQLFQTNSPMVSFLEYAVADVRHTSVKMVVDPNVFENVFEIIQVLDLSNSGNPLPCELIKLPTATKSSIRSADLSNEKKGSFVKNAKQMIVVLVQIRFRNVAHLNIKLHVAHPHSPLLT